MHPFLKKEKVQSFLSGIFSGYLSWVYKTSRNTVKDQHHVENFFHGYAPAIIVFWHKEMAMAPFAWKKGTPFHMLISSHEDGRLIARTVHRFGIQCIQGSSSHHQGAVTLKKMLKILSDGMSVGITPDGPRGPREVLKTGVYALARLSGCPVVTLRWNSTSQYVLKNTWDQMKIPLPFGRIEWVWGCPIVFDPVLMDKDAFQRTLYQALS